MASLESELQQANRREEQLRASRAQCEYQLQQAGEVAQSQVPNAVHTRLQVASAWLTSMLLLELVIDDVHLTLHIWSQVLSSKSVCSLVPAHSRGKA